LMKTHAKAIRTSDWAKGSPSNRTRALSTQPTQEWLREMSLNILDWPNLSPDLDPIKYLRRDLTIVVQRCSQSNLTELEWGNEWENLYQNTGVWSL
jgi:hypothetical protein